MRKNQGISLIEVIIAAAIISIGILSLISSFTVYVRYAVRNNSNVQAAFLAEEGLEVMSYFRDKGWAGFILPLSTTTPYYLEFNGSDWATTTSQVYADGKFLRKISVADVRRNSDGTIAQTGGTYDPDTKKITVDIEYSSGGEAMARSLSTYIANIR